MMADRDGATTLPADTALPLGGRIQSEFLEMPGLRLTPAQAARLWALDRKTSERLLETLVTTGFLLKTRDGAYLRS